MPPGRPALFLDRDGTIIEDRHYLHDPEGVVLLPGAARGIARFNTAGWPVIVVSNQSGIGRGIFDEDAVRAVMDRMLRELGSEGATITASYFCPHTPADACDCRKPRRALFDRAASELSIDLAASHYVGDRLRDVEPGISIGARGYLLRDGDDPGSRDGIRVVDSIDSVADIVLGPAFPVPGGGT